MATKIPENPFIGIDLASGPDRTVFGIRAPDGKWFHADVKPQQPPIDLRKRPDGVWEMPK